MLNWSASQSSTSAYVYFSGVPQIIKVVGDYLKINPMSAGLQEAAEGLIQSIESESTNIEIRRWLLRLKELLGETQVSLPLAAGDAWADTALKEIYALDSKARTAWAELLIHCLQATGSAPSSKWLKAADQYIDTIGNLNLFIKLCHWFPLIDHVHPTSANTDILRGLVWLCCKSDDPEIARALAGLAVLSYKRSSRTGSKGKKVGNACVWALGKMPSNEGNTQLGILKLKINDTNAQKIIANALEGAIK